MHVSLTLPALERLIGGETEIEVHLRQQIVEKFAEKHLKAIVNREAWKAAYTQWQAELEAAVSKILKEYIAEQQTKDPGIPGTSSGYRLQHAIEQAADKAVERAVQRVVDSQKRYMEGIVQRSVDRAMEAEIKKRIDEGVAAKLQAMQELLKA